MLNCTNCAIDAFSDGHGRTTIETSSYGYVGTEVFIGGGYTPASHPDHEYSSEDISNGSPYGSPGCRWE